MRHRSEKSAQILLKISADKNMAPNGWGFLKQGLFEQTVLNSLRFALGIGLESIWGIITLYENRRHNG